MPKRSAGCFECRKRKVRCDETKPECNTCLRRGTKCPGYRPPQSFILHQFEAQAERPALIREDDNTYKYANQSPETSPTQKSPPARAVARLPDSQRKPVDAPVPRQVSPIAIDRVQHLGTFIALYLPSRGGALPPPSALILALPTMPASSEVLLASIDALSAAQLAVNNKNLPLINRSRSLYGSALTQMLKAIQDPKTALQDETLLSTYLMTLYEVFVGVTQGHGFFYHVQGLLHLLRQRGPSSFNTRLSMQIFHAIRYNSLSIGYHLRRASMLDSPEWLGVTYKAAKFDPYIALLDICICIPRLLERTDKLGPPGAASEDDVDNLISDVRFHADRAFDWFKDFQKDGPRYKEVDVADMEGFLDICPDRTFDPVFDFENFSSGICYMIYWMSMLIMQSNTFKIYRMYRKLEPKQLMLWDRELSGYADSICRSVPYNCRQATGYTARFGSLTPLVVAKKYFEAKGAKTESQWCETVYFGARVPGLYSQPTPMEPLKAVKPLVQNNKRFI